MLISRIWNCAGRRLVAGVGKGGRDLAGGALGFRLVREFGRVTGAVKPERKHETLRRETELDSKHIKDLPSRLWQDEVIVEVKGGTGGPGCYSFVRTRIVTTGHADGANGGRGGDVYIVGSSKRTEDLSYLASGVIEGNEGRSGGSHHKTGDQAKDTQILVPITTKVTLLIPVKSGDKIGKTSQKLLCDSIKDGERVLVAKGGRGGLGTADMHYKPDLQKGEEGRSATVKLELAVPSDVALLGFSKSGKSTIMSAVTRVISKIGDSDVNTMFPLIGYIKYIDEKKLRICDLPPLMKTDFGTAYRDPDAGISIRPYSHLKHLKATSLITIVLAGDSPALQDEVIAILKFLKQSKIDNKKVYFAVSRMDLVDEATRLKLTAYFNQLQAPYTFLSGLKSEGLGDFVYYLRSKVFGDNLPK